MYVVKETWIWNGSAIYSYLTDIGLCVREKEKACKYTLDEATLVAEHYNELYESHDTHYSVEPVEE